MRRFLTGRLAKVIVFLLALSPILILLWLAFKNDLSANPIEYITRYTGRWTLRFLLITLAITPLRKYTRVPELIRFRRMLGLFAFFYGCLHLMTYVWLDQFFDVMAMLKDVAKRPFITAGTAAYLLMLPLAITSTAGWIRRLGGKRWQRLHRLIYFSTFAGVIHYLWLVKSDIRSPVMYGLLLALAIALRLPMWLERARQSKARPAPAAHLDL